MLKKKIVTMIAACALSGFFGGTCYSQWKQFCGTCGYLDPINGNPVETCFYSNTQMCMFEMWIGSCRQSGSGTSICATPSA